MTCRPWSYVLRLSFLFALLVVRPAAAQDTIADHLFHVLVPVYSGAGAWDARTTLDCVDRFAWCSEGNVTGLKQIADKYGTGPAMATKIGIHSGIILGLSLAREKWPNQKKAINGALVILSSFQFYVNIKNDQTIQKARGL